MQTSKPSPTTGEWPRHLRITSLMLMSLLTPKLHATWARPYPIDTAANHKHHSHHTKPYLTKINPPALRFVSAKSPSELLNRPPIAAGPPILDTPDDAAHEESIPPTTPDPVLPREAMPDATATESIPLAATKPDEIQKIKPPPSIIPDDVPERTKHEDFLPFFRFPGQSEIDVTVAVPAPDQPSPPTRLPPSSATYQQQ